VNLYCSGEAKDGGRSVKIQTSYPYGGEINVIPFGGKYKLFLRNPKDTPVTELLINGESQDIRQENGYLILDNDWKGQEIKLTLDIRPRLAYTNLKAQINAGKAAITRGPLVYCAEDADNGKTLGSYVLPAEPLFDEEKAPDGLPAETVALKASVYKYADKADGLYSYTPPELVSAELKLIPYFLWANRGEGEMRTQFIIK
jgi:DUF1680 family protein